MSDFRLSTIGPEEAVNGRFVVRAPREFADGSAPGALNLPLLDDAAWARVGVVCHGEGARAARPAAVDLPSPLLPAHTRSLLEAIPPSKRVAVMRWRAFLAGLELIGKRLGGTTRGRVEKCFRR
ncbi:MAG: hypothetical protein GXX83_02240 [Gaiellales bacterium]|nr:hypothetical protein [Gaiellales bacterium]